MSDVTKADLNALEGRLGNRLDDLKATMHDLATFQREANGRTGRLETSVAVHESRLDAIKDTRTRILVILSIIIATGGVLANIFLR